MRKTLLVRSASLLLILLVPLLLSADQQTYQISPEHSSLTFDVSAQIHQVRGNSKAFSGTIVGDPSDITSARINVKLDPQTFDTDNKSRDKVMREKSLEIQKYPDIQFTSTSIEAPVPQLQNGQPAKATIHGILKMHGMEKETAIPVLITWNGGALTAVGDLALRLDDWNIYRPKVVFFRLQNDIRIHFQIGAIRR